MQGPSQGLQPGSSMNGDIWAIRVRVDKMPHRNPEGNGLDGLDLSQNLPPGQGTQTGRGLQVARAAPALQETAGRQGRHDLEAE